MGILGETMGHSADRLAATFGGHGEELVDSSHGGFLALSQQLDFGVELMLESLLLPVLADSS